MKTILILLLFCITLFGAPQELRVGIYDNAPKIFLDKEGNPSGFFTDILAEIAKREDWELHYKACAWQECLAMLERGELDIMSDVAYSKEREELFLFNKEVVLSNWSTIYTSKKSKINSILDLHNKRVALLEHSIQKEQIREIFSLFGLDVVILSVKSFEEAFTLTQNGIVDATIVNKHFGNKYYKAYELIQTPIHLNPAALKFALPKKGASVAIAARIDHHLALMKQIPNSPYYALQEKWLSAEEERELPEWFYPFVLILLLLIMLLVATVLFFRYLVDQKTKKIVTDAQHLQNIENEKAHNYRQILYSLIAMIEQRDSYTAGHSQRVAHYCELIAQEMGCTKEEQHLLYKAAMLHDIGKIATPDSILLKPEKLTQTEYAIIQEHVNVGVKILQDVPIFQELVEIIRYHHEKYDGSGYPQGVMGDAIPKLSRIMMVADAFDAMTTNRIYKHKKSSSDAIREILELSGSYYHPDVAQAAITALKGVDTSEDVNQTPRTVLEEQRFVYFYKDSVTELYNAKYLEATLINNEGFKAFKKIAIISLHQFDDYNKKHGWEDGDKVLKEFALLLKKLFANKALFRVRANDFIVLLEEEISDLQKEQIRKFLEANELSYECIIHDVAQNQITSYEVLKRFL